MPDQHLGRNTAYDLGIPLNEMAVWNPMTDQLETEQDPATVKIILWKGHCSVHEKFTVDHIRNVRERDKNVRVIVHPNALMRSYSSQIARAPQNSSSIPFARQSREPNGLLAQK